MNYLDAFSGYGGFHKAFEEAGWEFDKVYFSEINKYAIANYKYNYPESIYAGSIDTICQSGIIEELDLFTFGWPCQDNSVAGKRQGQRAGTRSGLLYSAVEVIAKYRPGVFVAENVEGLRTVNKGIDIVESLKVLAFLNDSCPQYDIEMQLLNSCWFLPQNRERLIFVGHLRGGSSRKIFPIGQGAAKVQNCIVIAGSTIGEDNGRIGQRDVVYDPIGIIGSLTSTDYKQPKQIIVNALTEVRTEEAKTIRRESMKNGKDFSPRRGKKLVERKDGVMNTITATQSKEQFIKIVEVVPIITDDLYPSRSRDYENLCPTLTSNLAGRLKLNKIRRLTPMECERLQGLPDNWTSKGNFNGEILPISDSQRYKLCGNGVSIPVIKAVAEKLKSIQQFKEL